MQKEIAVINSVLQNKDIAVLYADSVDDLFETHGDVWKSIKSYHNKYHSIPSIDQMQEKFPDLKRVNVGTETRYYLDDLKAEHISNKVDRFITEAAVALQNDSGSRVLEKLQSNLTKLNRFTDSSKDLNIMDFDEAEHHYETIRERALRMGGTPGIPTGISFIDSSYTSGLAGGDLVVVLGWTARKKSLLTTLIACNAHSQGYRPMIISLEMSGAKVRDRVYTIQGSGLFQNSSLMLGDFSIDNFREFKKKHDQSKEFIVVTNDGVQELTPNVVQAKIDQHKPDLVIFDYAQLASDNAHSADMTARMRNMSKEFKRLAVNNDIPVVLISSATADSSAAVDSPPMIEQVAWSKQLAFDADLAFAVHGHTDSNLVEVACRKNRNGALFDGFLDWDVDNGKIEEKFL